MRAESLFATKCCCRLPKPPTESKYPLRVNAERNVYLGIDLGTSSVKAVLVDREQRVLAESTSALVSSRPRPGWSEQDPDAWWAATQAAVAEIRHRETGFDQYKLRSGSTREKQYRDRHYDR